jgi:hypothetical protein
MRWTKTNGNLSSSAICCSDTPTDASFLYFLRVGCKAFSIWRSTATLTYWSRVLAIHGPHLSRFALIIARRMRLVSCSMHFRFASRKRLSGSVAAFQEWTFNLAGLLRGVIADTRNPASGLVPSAPESRHNPERWRQPVDGVPGDSSESPESALLPSGFGQATPVPERLSSTEN